MHHDWCIFYLFYSKTTRYVSFYTRWERKNKSSTRTTPKQFPNFVIRTALVAMIGVKEQVRWRSSFIWPSRKPKKATVESFSISRQNVEAHKHAIASKQSSDPKLYKTETRIKTNKKKKKNKVRTPLASSFYVVLLVLCYSIFCCFFFLSNVMSILKITHSLLYGAILPLQ